MSFLDNLENNLKALESGNAGGLDENRRERERAIALAEAPWAERLKQDPFAQALMQQATLAGRRSRTKVHLMWIGNTLRLEARGHRLELRPGPMGISAVFLKGTDEIRQEPIDLADDPRKLTEEWMTILEEQKRLDDEQAALSESQELQDN